MRSVRHILCLSISKRHLQLDGKVQDSSKNLRFFRSYYGYTIVQMFILNANKVFSHTISFILSLTLTISCSSASIQLSPPLFTLFSFVLQSRCGPCARIIRVHRLIIRVTFKVSSIVFENIFDKLSSSSSNRGYTDILRNRF